MTPLMMATKNGNEKCIEILVENGADVNTKSKQVIKLQAFCCILALSVFTFSMPDGHHCSLQSKRGT